MIADRIERALTEPMLVESIAPGMYEVTPADTAFDADRQADLPYVVDVWEGVCTCPDVEYRDVGVCKHHIRCRALHEARQVRDEPDLGRGITERSQCAVTDGGTLEDDTENVDEPSANIGGEFNESLRGDAEQFGGENESDAVPTHHLRVTSADVARFADTKETLVVGVVALVWRQDPPAEEPDADFVAFVSQGTLERLAEGDIVNYGVRHINGENQTLHVSKGGVSDLFEDDRSPAQRIREEEPHLEEYVR